jgi:hypothetical protein
MSRRSLIFICVILLAAVVLQPHSAAQSSSSSSSRARRPVPAEHSVLDAGTVNAGVYSNAGFGFTCKIPAGWVLRTDEMKPPEWERGDKATADSDKAGRVLLAAFSRPPEARAEDVNGSILIAAESAAAIPGLKEAAQYFVLVNEAAKAQGLEMDDEPYDFTVGAKTVVRGDFQKDVGTRVMRQSTLVVLARGYVVSFTFVGGAEDEVEELVNGLSFGASAKLAK